ncbi:MAG: glucose 1-dehydrogenase [Xanthomonadales bacterium]|nr:glucose 1-dehydrogenase [Gammaproteobacteria bacterium]NND56267.1 glucose 1-dehydrogenase [Xanthomonadales bacterium]
MTDRLKGKVALVTGAGNGIGEATAKRFGEEGARVVVSDINTADAESVATEIMENGGQAIARHQDAADEAGWDALIDEIIATWGQLNVLVNNAGIVIPGTIEDTTLEDWRKTQAVNTEGVFLGCRAAVRAMKENGGSIINLSSIEGLIGEPTIAAYNASKGAVRLLTKSAALHCAGKGYGIRVNSIHPGAIGTRLFEEAIAAMPDGQEVLERVLADIPLGTPGEPLDIANGCLFLASDESKYMTGSELVIDGGYTCH